MGFVLEEMLRIIKKLPSVAGSDLNRVLWNVKQE